MGYGVTHVFGQPGGQTVALYDGLARRAPRIRHSLVRDERSAAYAADAFARLTGRPGVCDVTVGPGTTKLADGLVESHNASVPVVALVGELPRDWAPYRESGVHASRATTELTALAERLDAVVVTSFSGKGAVDETAPYAAGVLNPLGTTASLELARRADVVLWCGCKVGQNTSHNWSLPLAHQATIHLDADPAELGRTFRPTVALNGDVRATLAAVLETVPQGARPRWRRAAREVIEESARQRSLDECSEAVPSCRSA